MELHRDASLTELRVRIRANCTSVHVNEGDLTKLKVIEVGMVGLDESRHNITGPECLYTASNLPRTPEMQKCGHPESLQ
jgi:hypothetical protein